MAGVYYRKIMQRRIRTFSVGVMLFVFAFFVRADLVLLCLPPLLRRPELYKVLAMLSTCGCSCIFENADINDCMCDSIALRRSLTIFSSSSFLLCDSKASWYLHSSLSSCTCSRTLSMEYFLHCSWGISWGSMCLLEHYSL